MTNTISVLCLCLNPDRKEFRYCNIFPLEPSLARSPHFHFSIPLLPRASLGEDAECYNILLFLLGLGFMFFGSLKACYGGSQKIAAEEDKHANLEKILKVRQL